MKTLFIAMIALVMAGCISLGDDRKPATYEEAIQKEVAELLKSYRMCLQKNEDAPQKAKENCTAYHDAIQDLAPDDSKRSIGAFLDRLLKSKPSRERDRAESTY